MFYCPELRQLIFGFLFSFRVHEKPAWSYMHEHVLVENDRMGKASNTNSPFYILT